MFSFFKKKDKGSGDKKTIRSSSITAVKEYNFAVNFGDTVDYENIDRVLTHPKVVSSVRTRCNGSTSFPRSVQNASDVDPEILKVCKNLFGIDSQYFNINDFARKVLDGLLYGYSIVQATQWKTKSIEGCEVKVPTMYRLYDQREFYIDSKSRVFPASGMYATEANKPVDLDRYLCHLFINKAQKKFYSGTSEIDKLYNHVLLSQSLIEHEDNYYEKLAVAPLAIRVDGITDQTTLDNLAQTANGLRSGGAGVFNDIEELKSINGNSNNGDFENAQKAFNNLFDVVILGTSKIIENSSGQAYNSSVKSSEITLQIAKADADIVQTALNAMIKFFVEVNYGISYVAPKMLLESGDFVNYEVMKDMYESGQDVSKKAMKIAGFIDPENEDDILRKPKETTIEEIKTDD